MNVICFMSGLRNHAPVYGLLQSDLPGRALAPPQRHQLDVVDEVAAVVEGAVVRSFICECEEGKGGLKRGRDGGYEGGALAPSAE
jgi:hypothetical protein